jgi:hypothetical protein
MVNAANINLNTNSKVEYGQGVVLATTCDTFLTLKITREIDSASGNFYAKDLTIGDISTQLHSKRVNITLNDASESKISSSNLYFDVSSTGIVFTSPHATTSSINYLAVSSGGANEVGTSSITFTNIRKQDSSRILADEITRVLIETSGNGGCTAPVLSCSNGGTCSAGDIGPGGGPVIYVATTPFVDPVSGNSYKYIEAAPKNWIAGVIDPNSQLCLDSDQIPAALSDAIGSSIQNTNLYFLENDCKDLSSISSPTGLLRIVAEIRRYGSGWNLPTLQELQAMCKIARFGGSIGPTKANCNDSGGNLDTSNWLNTASYASSSKQSGAGWTSFVTFSSGVTNNTNAIQGNRYNFRPVRYFN